MWRGVAPLLAKHFTVVCADLRGYGQSACPASTPDHAPYAKRAMARDMVAVMQRLGHSRFAVAGHDRGGRVAYRLALDHPDRVERLAVLDVLPIETVWERADDTARRSASGRGRCWRSPNRCLSASSQRSAEAIIDNALQEWGSAAVAFSPEVRAAYVAALANQLMRMPSARNIVPPPASTASTTGKTAPTAAHRLPGAGAVERGRSARHLVPGWRPARTVAGGPTMSADRPLTAAISSRKSCPRKPPTRSPVLRRLRTSARNESCLFPRRNVLFLTPGGASLRRLSVCGRVPWCRRS